MIRYLILGLALIGIPGFLAAQDDAAPKKHRIDKWLESAIDRDPSTAGMVQATSKAAEMWDSELNGVYKQLLEVLSKSQVEKLKASQRKWLEYRDAEFAFSDEFYGSMQGTMWRPVAVNSRMDIVRSRTLELQSYLETLSGQ